MTSTITDATTNSLGDITMTGYDPNTDNLSSSVTTGSNAGLLLQPPMVKEITAVTWDKDGAVVSTVKGVTESVSPLTPVLLVTYNVQLL